MFVVAFVFFIRHAGQKRKGPVATPYVNHPLMVAALLADCGVDDAEILAGAILHDTLEDTSATEADLESRFGARVTAIVKQVTDDRTLCPSARKRAQIEHGPHLTPEARLVKLADSINGGGPWNPERVQGYCVWGRRVCEGVRGVNATLDAMADDLWDKTFVSATDGKTYPIIPKDVDLDAFLEQYYKNADGGGKK